MPWISDYASALRGTVRPSIWMLLVFLSLTLSLSTTALADCEHPQEESVAPTAGLVAPVEDPTPHSVWWWLIGGLEIMIIGGVWWNKRRRHATLANIPTVSEPSMTPLAVASIRPNQPWNRVNAVSQRHTVHLSPKRSFRSKRSWHHRMTLKRA